MVSALFNVIKKNRRKEEKMSELSPYRDLEANVDTIYSRYKYTYSILIIEKNIIPKFQYTDMMLSMKVKKCRVLNTEYSLGYTDSVIQLNFYNFN